ncbi:MAG: AraC family transcriptional regulator [Muricomes sp.]
MNIQSSTKSNLPIEQPMELCFSQAKSDGIFDFLEANKELASGHVKQLAFKSKFLISYMDYAFHYPTRKDYTLSNQFIEILYLESIQAESWEYELGRFPVQTGISTYVNQKRPGKLIFLPHTPIRGIRIMIFEEFYLQYLRERFSDNDLNIRNLIKMNYKIYGASELQPALSQIKHSIENGVSSELYYEGKIMEILYLLTNKANETFSPGHTSKRRLTEEDLLAVRKAKALIDGQLSAPPKISELAALTNTSATKLQSDFQLAFGSTIHRYVSESRMKEAIHKIDGTDEPIYSIAKSVGCKNPSRFAELFKKTYGITPTEYRKLRNTF